MPKSQSPVARMLANNPGLQLGAVRGREGAGVQLGTPVTPQQAGVQLHDQGGVDPGSAVRTVGAGGFLPDLLLHPVFVPFQYIFRRLPDEGLYHANRRNLYVFECGAFTVPQAMVLAIAEYRFQPYRVGGIAGDVVPLEEGRLALQLGYDLNFSQYRKSQMRTEILPTPAGNQQAAFDGNSSLGGTIVGNPGLGANDVLQQVLQSVYDSGLPSVPGDIRPRSFLDTSSAGASLLPQATKGVQGPSRFPFSFVVEESQAVQMKVTAFGAVPIPISFFESVINGYLMPRTAYESMIKGIRP